MARYNYYNMKEIEHTNELYTYCVENAQLVAETIGKQLNLPEATKEDALKRIKQDIEAPARDTINNLLEWIKDQEYSYWLEERDPITIKDIDINNKYFLDSFYTSVKAYMGVLEWDDEEEAEED